MLLSTKAGSPPQSIIGGSCHKYHFCRDKSFVATNTCLSRQNTSCRDKFCRDKIMFVATKYFCREKYLSRQTRVCRNKRFVATKDLFCFSPTNTCLSRKTYFCRGKITFVATNIYILKMEHLHAESVQELGMFILMMEHLRADRVHGHVEQSSRQVR